MHIHLNLLLEYSCSCGLIKLCYFKYVRCIDVVVLASSHNMMTADIQFIDWHLPNMSSPNFKSWKVNRAYIAVRG